MNRALLGVASLAFVFAAAGAQIPGLTPPKPVLPPPDAALQSFVRKLVADSLRSGGMQESLHFMAADSLSELVLTSAGVTLEARTRGTVVCPASTTADGAAVPPPFGYRVTASLKANSDNTGWIVGLGKTCTFVKKGRSNSFYEGASWEVHKDSGVWHITKTLTHLTT